MTPRRKRLVLYGSALSLAGALLLAGFAVKLPPDKEVLLSSAALQAQLGFFEQARGTLQQLLGREPRNGRALWMDAFCAQQLGRKGEAVSGYQKALENLSNPDYQAEIRIALAGLEAGEGNPVRGLQWLRTARPASSFWQARLLAAEGACYEASGELGEAQARYEGAAALCDATAKFSLARLKFLGGEAEKSSTLLRELASEDPSLLRRLMQRDGWFSGAIREQGLAPEAEEEGTGSTKPGSGSGK